MNLIAKLIKPLAISLTCFIIFFVSVFLYGDRSGFEAIPPVQVLYGAAHVEWLAKGRIAVHSVVATCLLIAGCLQFTFPKGTTPSLLRLRTIMFGIVLIVIAGWNITIVGLVLFGGPWHLASFLFGVIEATVIVTSVVMALFTQNKVDAILDDMAKKNV